MKTSFSRNLLFSTFLWIICVLLVSGIEKILLVSIFLMIPILTSLIPTLKRDGNTSSYHALLMKYHLYLAITTAIALAFPTGSMIAGIFSIPWAVYSLALYGYGARRFMERGWYIMEENAVDTSFWYAFLGGVTLSLYCFTTNPDFSNHLLMTAILFYFTAIFSTLFIGLVGRILPLDRKIGHLYRWAARGMMVSPLIIGIGILTNPWIQNAGLWIYTICVFIYSYFVILQIKMKNTFISLCIKLSAIVLTITTILVVIRGIFQLQGHTWLNEDQWLFYIEIPNILGFAVGVFGWYYQKPVEKNNLYRLPHINIIGDTYIGTDFLQRNGYVDQKVSHAGIMVNLDKFARNDLIPNLFHPKVRSFYENTSLYDVAIQARWTKASWLFEKCHKAWSKKMQQTNAPSPKDGTRPIDSRIISVINNEQYWNKKLHAWSCNYKDSNEVFFLGIYSDHLHNGERYVHITYPITKSSRVTIYRAEHGIDGSLQLTSIPRRGGVGDEGNYLMIKNFSIRLPLIEHFHLWVDEYGRLQVTHRYWLFGIKMVNLEYEMTGK